jgi:2-hydroxychromene-2-carboxylate isomerase
MARTIDFYFDFISPFSYLAYQRLPDLAERYGYMLAHHPADLADLKRLAGNTAPRITTIPLKLRYSRIDQQRWAHRYGVPIKPPAYSHDSSWLNRGAFFALDRGQVTEYVKNAWGKMRGDGRDIADEGTWRDVATELGWMPDEFVVFVRSDAAQARYQVSTLQAHERGVFGVPTMMIGEDMWWGNDRLDFLEEFLQAIAGTDHLAAS